MPTKRAARPGPSARASKQTKTAAELVDLIVGRAPALIAVGVTSIAIDGFSVHLTPPPPLPLESEAPALPTQHIDPLLDPATYPGGRIPGFRREHEVES